MDEESRARTTRMGLTVGRGVTMAEQGLSEGGAMVPDVRLAVEAERLVKQFRGRSALSTPYVGWT